MLISEVCKICKLTKKAVEYYEKQGLICPDIEMNGYRNYTESDIARLKEIAVYRSLGMSVNNIQSIMASKDKALAQTKSLYLKELEKEKLTEQAKIMKRLISDHNVENAFHHVHQQLLPSFTIREKLLLSFPGIYGTYLSSHFGSFLNVRIDMKEKEEAYATIVQFLDGISVPAELEEYTDSLLPALDNGQINSFVNDYKNNLEDIESLLKDKEGKLQEYISYRSSESFQISPAYKLQQMIMKFQQSSGYKELFIENLKIISPGYKMYIEKLQEANQKLLEQYPDTNTLFNRN